jgi:mannose-6-phosphate isomerase-like protein (cupin superfamily)
MLLLHKDNVVSITPNSSPDYDRNNPLTKIGHLIETTTFASERQHYLPDSLQYLFSVDQFEFYGPQGGDSQVLDVTKQDNKTDFQKQNVRTFTTGDTLAVRGLATAGDWLGPFIKLSYQGGPDSKLSILSNHQIGSHINLWLKVNSQSIETPIRVPYNPDSDRYEMEIWSCQPDIFNGLSEKGQNSVKRGALLFNDELVSGSTADFARYKLTELPVKKVASEDAMHPINPLRLELAWSDEAGQIWDSQGGTNYVFEFNMQVRGWDNYLAVGSSSNPHGGIGQLEYRNLFSNYFQHAESKELGRTLNPWNFNAFGSKQHSGNWENFFAVDYMDLHIVRGNGGIGLHRHRDNQEVFMMISGRALMIVGDWCKFPSRERCIEVRTLRAGHLAMLKGGQLHALLNPTDEDAHLFMFGGYD